MSREHYVSESLLKALNVGTAPVLASGFHWLHGNPKEVPTKALTARVLCERHNSALSPLDSVAQRLMDAFNCLNAKRQEGFSDRKEHIYLFNGHDVERWVLKVLCGIVVSGNASTDGESIRGWRPSEQWLRILFGEAQFPQRWGLYMRNAVPGAQFFGTWDFRFAPLSDGPRMQGAAVSFNSCPFLLAMDDPPADRGATPFAESTYRPKEIRVRGNGVIVFGWDEKGDDRSITFE
jgi:hypothetical protein